MVFACSVKGGGKTQYDISLHTIPKDSEVSKKNH